MEIFHDYIKFCRIVGPWTDWFQGLGGNLSVKTRSHMFIKQSGTRITDTTKEYGWMLCEMDGLRGCLEKGNEDFSETVVLRAPKSLPTEKPSIEAVLHMLPHKYILYAHPIPLMTQLCTPDSTFHIPTFKSKVVPYAKPGIPLANLIQTLYEPSVSIYFLRNNGVLICAENLEEILIRINSIRIHCFPAGVHTQIPTAAILAQKLNTMNEQPLLLLPTFQTSSIRSFIPYTPDIAVFFTQPVFCIKEYTLQKPNYIPQVISIDNHLYLVGETLEECHILQELLQAYLSIHSTFTVQLLDSEVASLR